nr:ribonuclease H-like domain, reverse transcriptase, RNA-dependent DNA polymerase [Tanacetum cinerariifolium]
MIKPNEKTQADNKKDKTAIAFLYQALPEEQLLQITKHKTAKAIWDALKTRHIGEERVQQARLQTLKSEFELLHMTEDETIDTFTTKLTTLVNKAASLGHTMEDETLVRKLLNAVPDRYLQIVASMEQYSDLDEMTLKEAICRLKTYEERIKVPFPKKAKARSTSPLDLVYGDLCGPITPPTPSGKKYIFLLVDDYSRYMWVYFLTTKDQAFDTFKEYKNSIENELRTTLKMLRTDRGGEFTLNEFTQYCKENGIARQFTAPYSPQQNGVVERRNRTIMSTTICMMKTTNMPQNFWAEAVRHAIYILNSVPTKALEDITPYEAIKQRKPNLDNLRVFGCIAYAKVPSQHLPKLDDRSIKMDYMSEHTNDEPEWTDFKIGDHAVTNEYNDQETQPIENDNEFPNDVVDDYASPTRDSPLHSQTPHTPSTHSSENTEELLLAEDEPKNYKEASNDQKWIEAMIAELDSINKNNTWELTTLPKGQKAIGLKWVFKTKKDANGDIIKHKARLVAKGYIQQHDIDFEEVLAPVARMETIRLLLAIAANNKWEVHHLDIKFAFLHGDLKEEVYVTQPEGFIKRQDNEKVYRLIKALYGLRQAPRAWNIELDNTLKSLDFKKCALEQAIYTKTSKNSTLLIGVHDYGITYKHNGGNKIHGFSDSSYGINTLEGKGTTDIIFYYGESPISWSTQKQATVALSSCESEFIVATAATTQALWLKRLLSKLTHSQEEKITIQVDNKSAIALMKNSVFHERSKHIDTKYHFIRECIEKEDIKVEFVNGEYQRADILTRPKSQRLRLRGRILGQDPNNRVIPNRRTKTDGYKKTVK